MVALVRTTLGRFSIPRQFLITVEMGKATAVGEKMLAAHRAGIQTVFLPKENENDLEELPEEIKKAVHFILVEEISQVLTQALENCPDKKK